MAGHKWPTGLGMGIEKGERNRGAIVADGLG